MNTVITEFYKDLPLNKTEALRYAGCPSDEEPAIFGQCVKELDGKTDFRVCYSIYDVEINNNDIDFGFASVKSELLAKNLDGCRQVILFAATIGIDIDRLIEKYNRISPAKALIFQGLGAERIETLCDTFCKDMNKKHHLRPRFSPGYGDLPLEFQKQVFAVLDCPRKIGVSLNESLLMSPSKSVTAIIGISDTECNFEHKCSGCTADCEFRRND